MNEAHTTVPEAPREEGGVRRINRRPLILFSVAAGLIFLLLLWALGNRMKPIEAKVEESETPTAAAPSDVAGITKDAPTGLIPEDEGLAGESGRLRSPDDVPIVIPAADGAYDGRPVPRREDVSEEEALTKMRERHTVERQRYFLDRDLEAIQRKDRLAAEANNAITYLALPNLGRTEGQNRAAQNANQTLTRFSPGADIGALSFGQSTSNGLTSGGAGNGLASQLGAGPDYSGLQAAIAGGNVDPNGQERKREFSTDINSESDYLNKRLQSARSPYEVKQGTIIPGIMISGINSDLPGVLIGQVSQDVYDTVTGSHLLIPQGTRIFGRYDSNVTLGQKRVLVVWTRLIYPNGDSINIDVMSGSDQAGYAGFKDKVDRHLWELYGQAILLSAIGGGIDAIAENENDDNLTRAIRRSFSDEFSRTTSRVIDRNLDVQPTLKIRPGYRFVILVDQDMTLRPYRP